MPITINGSGTISGVSATGLTTAQTVSASNITTGTLAVANGGTGTTVGVTGFKNRIINGAMVIDQRNAGASVTNINGTVYTVDRFSISGSVASKFTAQQNAGSVTPPAGFSYYLGMTSSSAYSVGSTDFFICRQAIEGFNTADLGWGTANAKTVTLSFQVYSSLTGTFGGCIQNPALTRNYPFTYTISSANTWTTISVTVAGDTSGTWVGATNAASLYVTFSLGAGSTYTGTAGAWSGTAYVQGTGSTSVVGTNGATFYITGVQLEVGSTATSFDYRPYGTELALCQRYYETLGFGLLGIANSSTGIWAQMLFKVQKRVTPTVGLYTATQTWGQFGVANRNSSSVSIGDSANTNTSGSISRIEGFSSMTANAPLGCLTDIVFTLSAEL